MDNLPIINPMWFYWMGIADYVKGWSIGFALIFVVAVCACGVIMFDDDTKDETVKKAAHWMAVNTFISIFFVFLSIVVPSQKTIEKMMIASVITPKTLTETINKSSEITGNVGAWTKDFIISAIKEINTKKTE